MMQDVEYLISHFKGLIQDDDIAGRNDEKKNIFEMGNEKITAQIFQKTSYRFKITFPLKIWDDEFTNIEIILDEDEAIFLREWEVKNSPGKHHCSNIRKFLQRNKNRAHVSKFEKYFSEIFSGFFQQPPSKYFPSTSIDLFHFWSMNKYCHIFTLLGCSIPDNNIVGKALERCMQRSSSSNCAVYRSSEFELFLVLKKIGCKFLAEIENCSGTCLLLIIFRGWRRKIIRWRKFSWTVEKIIQGETFEKPETAANAIQVLLNYLSEVNHFESTSAVEILRIILLLLDRINSQHKSIVISSLKMNFCTVRHCIISRHFLLFLADFLGIKTKMNLDCRKFLTKVTQLTFEDGLDVYLDYLNAAMSVMLIKLEDLEQKKKKMGQPKTLQLSTCRKLVSFMKQEDCRNLFTFEKIDKLYFPTSLKALILECNQFLPKNEFNKQKEQETGDESRREQVENMFFSSELVLKNLLFEWAIKKQSCEKLVRYMQSHVLR